MSSTIVVEDPSPLTLIMMGETIPTPYTTFVGR